MHQFGVGVPRDLHIAKRYYDLSLQQNADAFLPVGIALFGLRIHNLYQSYSGIKAPAIDFRGTGFICVCRIDSNESCVLNRSCIAFSLD